MMYGTESSNPSGEGQSIGELIFQEMKNLGKNHVKLTRTKRSKI